MRHLTITESAWPLAKAFVISRGSRTEARVLQVAITDGDHSGRGECVPYARYGESLKSVTAQIESLRSQLENGLTRAELREQLTPGAARNALDCAMWDLEAKLSGQSVAELSGLGHSQQLLTAQTLSIGTPESMAEEALLYKDYPLLKIKLDAELILERVQAVHAAAPQAEFIVDANEAWSIEILNEITDSLKAARVALIEQPLPAESDKALLNYSGEIPLCADESFHTLADLESLTNRYQAINIKLDKTGGLTEAIDCLHAARAKKLVVMVGCMVGTSLAMAPASLLARHADFVDLDGPALMAKDMPDGFIYKTGTMSPLHPQLWGN